MKKTEAERRKEVSDELLESLYRRSGARCEGRKLGLHCIASLTGDLTPLMHHIDGDPSNNQTSNLVLLCPTCHSTVINRLSEQRRKDYAKKVAKRFEELAFGERR